MRGLLATAKAALAKCKWMPPDAFATYKSVLAQFTGCVEAAAARSPGARMLPAEGGGLGPDRIEFYAKCFNCGQPSTSLKNCSICKVSAYCSRTCQVRHWKEGGHKQECEQMVVGSSGASGSSS